MVLFRIRRPRGRMAQVTRLVGNERQLQRPSCRTRAAPDQKLQTFAVGFLFLISTFCVRRPDAVADPKLPRDFISASQPDEGKRGEPFGSGFDYSLLVLKLFLIRSQNKL
jgi:hypothetical protein